MEENLQKKKVFQQRLLGRDHLCSLPSKTEQEMKADSDLDPERGRSLTPSAPPAWLDDVRRIVQGRGAKPLPPALDGVGEPRERSRGPPSCSTDGKKAVPTTGSGNLRCARGLSGGQMRTPVALTTLASSFCCLLPSLPALTWRQLRLSEWVFEPFTKPGASGPPGDAPPDTWDVEVGAPWLFQGQTRCCRVPRSALVRDCHRCHGRSKCGVCHGAGRTRRVRCKGSRRRLKRQERCQRCSGAGRRRCDTCSGWGSKTCATRQGEKKLQHFKQLVITWKNNIFEFVSEHHLDFPEKLLSKVSGENILKDEHVVVYTIIDFAHPEISLTLQRAIAERSAVFATSSRILRQLFLPQLIPVTEVHHQHSGKSYLYYVRGLQSKVYVLDYPWRCCGCTLICAPLWGHKCN
ncbi:LOW QUALITY PROTEIN: protein SSUH2 homolog [Rissa tridactyla]|uniref:LOW QUALITY PROTEIN: protein SSUH2 homolog n=1 Tax=Rissa tridactyla TaxID=75485 RepID=UPI0023BB16EE|nr:LOW QUALITY PROTEIN: protein SSUH2 homolog [Rissa tridactyla]